MQNKQTNKDTVLAFQNGEVLYYIYNFTLLGDLFLCSSFGPFFLYIFSSRSTKEREDS